MELLLREEFRGKRLKGTTIDFVNSSHTGALERPAEDFLNITYPSNDLIRLIEATGPGQSHPVVLLGERGQGKSHLMAALYHVMKNSKEALDWLERWSSLLANPHIQTLRLRSNLHIIAESLHHQEYKFLWDLLFEKHPQGQYIKGKWEGMGDKKPTVPSYNLLVEMFQAQPSVLILDEFQTWYDGLTNTKQYPWRNWAFNFIQLLSEISEKNPNILVLVVSIRNGDSEAYQQIHRINPVLLDFKGPYAKRDRQRLLLHRLFENRSQMPLCYIQKAVSPHLQEYFRLFNISSAEQDRHRAEFYETWPYAPHLLQLLEDQILTATYAQETRDMIRILADLFKQHVKTPCIITAADFRLVEDRSGVASLLDSVSSEYHRKLRDKAQRNLQAVEEACGKSSPHAEQIIGALWLRSLDYENRLAGADALTLQIDITKEKAIDDNAFQDELNTIVDNSYNIHLLSSRYVFQQEENPQTKLKAFARNDKLFQDGSDIQELAKEIRYVISGAEELAKRYRVVVLAKAWFTSPWAEVSLEDCPDRWDSRIPVVVIPEFPENLAESTGIWLKQHVSKKRNSIRFLFPDHGSVYYDKDLITLTRMVLKAQEWKNQDKEYANLHKKFQKELSDKIKHLFTQFAVLKKWNFFEPAKCEFHLHPHRDTRKPILFAMEEIINRDLFIPEEFEALVNAFAERSDSVGKLLSELQEPRTGNQECIPWLGEVEFKEKVLYLCAEGAIALNLRGMELLQIKPGESPEEAWSRMKGKLGTGKHLEETIILKPKPLGSTSELYDKVEAGEKNNVYSVSSLSGKPPVIPAEKPPCNIFEPGTQKERKTRFCQIKPTSALNLLGKIENLGIGPASQIINVRFHIAGMTGAQLQELLKKLPESMIYDLELEKEERD